MKRILVGRVVSDSMDKSVVVLVESIFRHPRYKKVVRRRKRFMADTSARPCHTGDTVRIEECRPLSRMKRWRVVEVVARGEVPEAPAGEGDA